MNYLVIGAVILIGVLILMRLRSRGDNGPAENSGEAPSPSPSRPSPTKNWLIGTKGSISGKTFFLGERTVTIGRDPGNFIQIQAEKASRHHCRISSVHGNLTLEDMNSTNGVEINGKKTKSHVLVDGDTITIGTDEFRFELFGDFHEDSAIERKDVSVAQYQMTEQNNEDLNVRIDAAMKSAGGNLEVAAENLGLKPEVLKKVLDKRRDGPDKW